MDGHRTGSPQGPGEQNPAYRGTHRHYAINTGHFAVYGCPSASRCTFVAHEDESTALIAARERSSSSGQRCE